MHYWALFFFPASLLTGGIAAGVNAPPVLLPMIFEVLFSFLILRAALCSLGPSKNLVGKTSLAVGLVAPIMVFGMVASLATSPLILIADMTFALLLRRLWRSHTIHPSFNVTPVVP